MTQYSTSVMRAITGPIVLITVGILFALDRFAGFPFSQSWPILLIVMGLLRLAGGGRRSFSRSEPPLADAPQGTPPYESPGAGR